MFDDRFPVGLPGCRVDCCVYGLFVYYLLILHYYRNYGYTFIQHVGLSLSAPRLAKILHCGQDDSHYHLPTNPLKISANIECSLVLSILSVVFVILLVLWDE